MDWKSVDSSQSPPCTYTILLKGKTGDVIAGYKDLDGIFHELRRVACAGNDNELRKDWVVAWAYLPTE